MQRLLILEGYPNEWAEADYVIHWAGYGSLMYTRTIYNTMEYT